MLAELQQEGLIRHLGVSNVNAEQLEAARAIAPVRTVQNFYNVAVRNDDALLDLCARERIAFVPFFPLAGSSRCSPTYSEPSPTSLATHPGRWRSRGSCTAPPRPC